MADFSLRPAKPSDAADLAILDNLACHGMSLWFWQKEAQEKGHQDALSLGRSRFAEEKCDFGWKNTYVAVDARDCILGAVNSYVLESKESEDTSNKQNMSIFTPVYELFEKCTGQWVIDSLAVFPEANRRGIGRRLLNKSLELARKARMTRASLVVEDSNEQAIALYASFGFVRKAQRDFMEFNGPSKTRHWLLMTADL